VIYITGITRSGTSLLTYFFLASSLKTGFEDRIESFKRQLTSKDNYKRGVYPLRGGLEAIQVLSHKIRRGDKFDVIKHPWADLERAPDYWLNRFDIIPDVVIITKRDIEPLIKSNKTSQKYRKSTNLTEEELANLYVDKYNKLAEMFPSAIWVEFPRFVEDFDYLWEKIGHLVSDSYEDMKERFEEIANLKYVRYT
jgi:hypothetical protein